MPAYSFEWKEYGLHLGPLRLVKLVKDRFKKYELIITNYSPEWVSNTNIS